MPSSRTALDGHTIHENATVSSSLRFTAIRKDENLPSARRRPSVGDQQGAVLLEHGRSGLRDSPVGVLVGRGNGDHISIPHSSCIGSFGKRGRNTHPREGMPNEARHFRQRLVTVDCLVHCSSGCNSGRPETRPPMTKGAVVRFSLTNHPPPSAFSFPLPLLRCGLPISSPRRPS
jgi:hypothetical protein